MKIRRLVAIASVALAALGVAGPAAAAGSYPPVPPPASGSVVPGLIIASQVAQAKVVVGQNGNNASVRAGTVISVLFSGVPCNPAFLTVNGGGTSATYKQAVSNGNAQVGPLQAAKPGKYLLTLSCTAPVSSQRGNAVRAAASSYSATLSLTVTNGVGAGGTTTNAGSSASGLPKTGGDGFTPLWVGLALLLTGGAFVGVTARRAKRSS